MSLLSVCLSIHVLKKVDRIVGNTAKHLNFPKFGEILTCRILKRISISLGVGRLLVTNDGWTERHVLHLKYSFLLVEEGLIIYIYMCPIS